MALALEKAKEIVERVRKEGYGPYVISAELKKAKLRQGDYQVIGCSSLDPNVIKFYIDGGQSFKPSIENVKKLENIVKKFGLEVNKEDLLIHKKRKIIGWVYDKGVGINCKYENAGKLLETIGRELLGASTKRRKKEVVKPFDNSQITFGERFNELIILLEDLPSFFRFSEGVDKIVKENVGELKVREGCLKVVTTGGRVREDGGYTVPLSEYIKKARKKKFFEYGDIFQSIGGIRYIVDAWNAEPRKFFTYKLANSMISEISNEIDYFGVPLILNEEKTRSKLDETLKKLEPKIPEAIIHFYGFCQRPFPGVKILVGYLTSEALKEGGKEKTEKVFESLAEFAKDFSGPSLSEEVKRMARNEELKASLAHFWKDIISLI